MAFHGYDILKKIGKGNFGSAYIVKNAKNERKYVLKRVDISRMPPKDVDLVRQETKLLAALEHPHIVSYRDSFWNGANELCLVMIYCEGGDLAQAVQAGKGKIPEQQLVEWFHQIALALAYLHAQRVLHRDLKPANVFLSGNKAILGDFGISRVLENSLEMVLTQVGTPYYMSPELLQNQPYSFKSDVWALGCMLYEVLALRRPFEAKDLRGLMEVVVRGRYEPVPVHFSEETAALVDALLQTRSDARPTMAHVVDMFEAHPLLRSGPSGRPAGPPRSGSPARLPSRQSPTRLGSPSRRSPSRSGGGGGGLGPTVIASTPIKRG